MVNICRNALLIYIMPYSRALSQEKYPAAGHICGKLHLDKGGDRK